VEVIGRNVMTIRSRFADKFQFRKLKWFASVEILVLFRSAITLGTPSGQFLRPAASRLLLSRLADSLADR
jgi:hypothetical protein